MSMDICSYYPYGLYGVQLTRSNLSVGTPFHELLSDNKEWHVQITNNSHLFSVHFDVFLPVIPAGHPRKDGQ